MDNFDKWYNENLLSSFGEDYRKMCKRAWYAGYTNGWDVGYEEGDRVGFLDGWNEYLIRREDD